jgi:hypothetical protein
MWGFTEFLHEAPTLFDLEKPGAAIWLAILAFLPVSMLSQAHVQ